MKTNATFAATTKRIGYFPYENAQYLSAVYRRF